MNVITKHECNESKYGGGSTSEGRCGVRPTTGAATWAAPGGRDK